jgi:hypothetical protein
MPEDPISTVRSAPVSARSARAIASLRDPPNLPVWQEAEELVVSW